jgi:transient receptor potential cation channel subfamily M protein 3
MEEKWMELAFNKRVCYRYVRSRKNDGRCFCGQGWTYHPTPEDANAEREESATEVWNPMTHTITAPTDAFGTIDFHDGPHPNKAQYIRLAHDSSSERIVQLLTRGWGLELPKLIISVHGGKANFDLSPRLKKIVQTGLLRAAKTTGKFAFSLSSER